MSAMPCPQPRRVRARLADDSCHEPALCGDIERGIVLLEDTRRCLVELVQVGLRDQRGDKVPGVLLGHYAPHLPRADQRRVVLGGPGREVAFDVGVGRP